MIIITAVITASLAHLFSIKHLKQKLERETAIKFLTEKYFPLLGNLERVAFAWYVLDDNDTRNEINLTEEETYHVYSEDLLKLSQTLETTTRSGAIILLNNINPEIHSGILRLDYLIKCYTYQIEQKKDAPINQNVIQGIMKTTVELAEELYGIAMPHLIDEYQRLMTDESSILKDNTENYSNNIKKMDEEVF